MNMYSLLMPSLLLLFRELTNNKVKSVLACNLYELVSQDKGDEKKCCLITNSFSSTAENEITKCR